MDNVIKSTKKHVKLLNMLSLKNNQSISTFTFCKAVFKPFASTATLLIIPYHFKY